MIGEKSVKDSQRADIKEARSSEFIQMGTKLPKEGEENIDEMCMLKEGDGGEKEERGFQTSIKDVIVMRRNNGIGEVDSCGPKKAPYKWARL